ncbi:MAG: IS4 family transposase [Chloroflexales bacterium]|nr:IS4 family transposase [Chloroflexales bacterium]
MMLIEQVASALQDVLTTIAQRLARETEFVQRESKLDGARFVQTLVFTYLANPDATLEELAQPAAALNVEITPEGLTQRFSAAAAPFLQQVLAEAVKRVLAGEPLAIALLARFEGVDREDSTTIVLPEALQAVWQGSGNGSDQGNAALKVNLRLNLTPGLLAQLTLHDGRVHDSQASQPISPLPAGALFLADLGDFSLARLARLAQHNSYLLSRLQAQTTVFTADGKRWDDVTEFLASQGEQVDLAVTLGRRQRLNARLLAVRVPQEVADQRRRRLRAEAKRKGQTVSARRLALAAWTLFITNAPAERVSVAAALVLGRTRWQLELLFKLWKRHGRIDESRAEKPWRVWCDVYAKLLAMVVQHWIGLTSVWDYPDRSLVKAAQTVQKDALPLAGGLWRYQRTVETLETLARCMAAGCRMNPRKKHPNTYQLLEAMAENALA